MTNREKQEAAGEKLAWDIFKAFTTDSNAAALKVAARAKKLSTLTTVVAIETAEQQGWMKVAAMIEEAR